MNILFFVKNNFKSNNNKTRLPCIIIIMKTAQQEAKAVVAIFRKRVIISLTNSMKLITLF